MGEALRVQADNDMLSHVPHAGKVSDELNRILLMLRAVCPPDAQISLTFDGRIHAHIDIRKREDVCIVESVLPRLESGVFHSLSRGKTPHHPFFNRISALVDC